MLPGALNKQVGYLAPIGRRDTLAPRYVLPGAFHKQVGYLAPIGRRDSWAPR